jgi:hypothetical protein
VYETEGCARAAITDAGKLPLLEPLAWTLQRDLHPELAELDIILSALKRAAPRNQRPNLHRSPQRPPPKPKKRPSSRLKTLRAAPPSFVRLTRSLNWRSSADRPTSTSSRCAVEYACIRVDGILTTLRTFAPDLARPIRADGMTTLIEDAMRAALAGETSLQEVLRVTASR